MRDAQKEWNEIAAEYDKKIVRGDFFREKILDNILIKNIGNVEKLHILDLGCGQGYLSNKLSLLGAVVSGIDISNELVSIAKTRYKNISFVVGDIEKKLPYQDHQFDVIVSNMVFMDVENPEKTIEEIKRVSKPGTRIIVSILHPIFTGGEIHKPISDFFLFKKPSFLLRNYKKQKTLHWKIFDTTHKTTVFHRPIEYYINLLLKNNISVVHIEEGVLEDAFNKNGFQKMLNNIPMFLVITGIINT